jgi:hypothetical protein
MTASDSEDLRAQRAKTAGKVLAGAAVLAVVTGLAIGIAGIIRQPNLEGIATAVFGAFFIALLIMGASAWIAMRMMTGPPRPPDLSAGDAIAASLKHVLDELELTRLETVNAVNRRATWRVPLCAAIGLVIMVLGMFSDDPPDLIEAAGMIIVPGIMGYVWASAKLSNEYALRYKARVLPELAKSFGDLSYRHAFPPDMGRLKEEGVFKRFDAVTADDEIHGTHRNLPLNIVELKLEHGSGDNRKTVFDGLLVSIDLPRDTNAVTAVISDAGAIGNFADRMKAQPMLAGQKRERVRLEDPEFEKVYEVYGTDQIAARALLHPAFMEKLLALGRLPDFGLPLVLCSGRSLQIAMPKKIGRDLFEPPGFQKPAASREALIQLRKDIETILGAADAVIDLDHRFEIMARR